MPDAVYKDAEHLIIIDAKYYNKGFLPQNYDITKQFAYMRKAYEYWKDSDITNYGNIFVLPTEGLNYHSDIQAYFDKAIARKNDLVPVDIIYLNFSDVVESYVSMKDMTEFVL